MFLLTAHSIVDAIQREYHSEELNIKNTQKQTTRTGTEPQKWSSHGSLSTGEWDGERGERYRE